MKRHLARLTICVLGAIGLYVVSGLGETASADQQCVDHSRDPAGCQPSTFDTPMAQMPSVRVNRQGQIDPNSSEADAKVGAFEVEKRLFLFRNLEHLHWVPLIPRSSAIRRPARGVEATSTEPAMAAGSASPAIASSSGTRTAPASSTQSTSSKIQPDPAKQPTGCRR